MSRSVDLGDLLPSSSDGWTGPAIEVEGLSVSFGGVHALSDVDAVVPSRKVTAIIGPNGAGKTTLLNAVSGLLQTATPTGAITFHGVRTEQKRATQIARLGLGRSFQHPPLLGEETVVENILLGSHRTLPYGILGQLGTPWRVRRAEARERDRALALLDFVGLSDVAHEKAGGLSYGASKRVDILRAVFAGPLVLALDEPTSGLDSSEQQKVVDLVNALSALERMTILLVEHHMDIVRAVAKNVFGMAAGKVIVHGTPDDVLESEAYRHAVIGGHTAPEAEPTPTVEVS